MSSAYLRLLIFLPAILIPACASFSPAFLMMYSAYIVVLISHASRVMLKILQARLQQYMNWEVPDKQSGFRKGRGSMDQIVSIPWIMERAREFQKNIYFCFIGSAKGFPMWITTNCGKFLKRWEYHNTLSVFWETCMQAKMQQLEPEMEQWIGSKLGKEYDKAIYCPSVFLTSMQSTSCEMLG